MLPIARLHRRGFSLVEVTASTMLVGVLLVAAMRTVAVSTFTQYRAAEKTTAQFLADGLLSEILAKNYKDPGAAPQFGLEVGETSSSKATYNDVDDYQNWNETPPQFADGTAMPDLDGWRRRVTVRWVDPADLTQTRFSESGAKLVTVSVEHNGVVVCSRVAVRTGAP